MKKTSEHSPTETSSFRAAPTMPLSTLTDPVIESLRAQAHEAGFTDLDETPVRDEEPYNTRTIGWTVAAHNRHGLLVRRSAPFLQAAYERLLGIKP